MNFHTRPGAPRAMKPHSVAATIAFFALAIMSLARANAPAASRQPRKMLQQQAGSIRSLSFFNRRIFFSLSLSLSLSRSLHARLRTLRVFVRLSVLSIARLEARFGSVAAPPTC